MDTLTKQELLSKLGDPRWRIRNLYFIKDEKGNKVLFTPNSEQEELLSNLWWFNIIPKARQLGITTFFCILYLDAILFSANKTACIIAHTREHSKKIFKDKIKFAWDNMPVWVKESIGDPSTDTTQEMTFPNGSTIFVTSSARSGAVQYLHISEFGPICANSPEKAKEIVTGSINTVHAGSGMVSIESTAAGKEGYFYDLTMEALQAQQEKRVLSELQFKLFFFPWWRHPDYALNSSVIITKEYQEYFDNLKTKFNIGLTHEQQCWYVIKHKMNKQDMLREYPSTIEEAFEASIEGAYYAKEMAKVYEDRRIRNIPYDSTLPVDTFWDLGMNDDTVIIFTQAFGAEIRIIDCYSNSGEGLHHYVKILKDRGYVYGSHFLPHDVEVRDISTGVSRKKTLNDLGLFDVRTAKKSEIIDGIDKVRSLFSRMYFDETKTAALTSSLSSYRKEWDDKLGVFKDKPRHDKNSHFADAMRVLAVSWRDIYMALTDQEQEEYKALEKETSFFAL